jgi:hypothetical protein
MLSSKQWLALMNLFDDLKREDPFPARPGEDSFTFLNRVDTPFWAKVRQLLEEWFGHYPADHAGELRNAFRSRLPGSHWGAWWELYLHELFLRLGYELEIHPTLPDSSKRPDFKLTRNESSLYLEAAAVFSGIKPGEDGDGSAPAWMLSAIETVQNPGFFVRLLEVSGEGQQLKRSEVVDPIQEWLDGHDPDQVAEAYEQTTKLPELAFEQRGWSVALQALPVKAEARGRPDHRILGTTPAQTGWVDDIDQLQSKLKVKAGRYGHPEIPMVTAILCLSPFMERLDIEQALFGREAIVVSAKEDAPSGQLVRQRNGFWIRGDGPQNQRVSAVLTAVNLQPWTVTRMAPELWLNSWSNYELNEGWPFSRASMTERGEIVHSESEPDLAQIFDLPTPWPGDKPFPRQDQ